MKKNIKQLKELVNNSVAEIVRLNVDGVQAYNISANEYEVITKFEKIKSRYYFIDRDGNKYLASRYDRADFIAGEMLERVAEENETVKAAVDSIAEKGEATINFDLFINYLEACEARGINSGELVERTEDAAGNLFNVYRIESDNDAADEQQTEGEEISEQSEENAATCEPSKLSGILAKVKSSARKVCEKVANVAFFSVAFGSALLALYVAVVGLTALLDVCGIEGGSWGAVALSVLLWLTVVVDFCVCVELNTMALLSRLFRVKDYNGHPMQNFTLPFSVWYRVIKEGRE